MGDFGAYNDTLVTAIQNGKCEKWKREVYAPTPTMFSESEALSRFLELVCNFFHTESTINGGLTTPVRAPLLPTGPLAKMISKLSSGGPMSADQGSSTRCSGSFSASSWTQFYVLVRRNFYRLKRDKVSETFFAISYISYVF
jgi:hypothetical protein